MQWVRENFEALPGPVSVTFVPGSLWASASTHCGSSVSEIHPRGESSGRHWHVLPCGYPAPTSARDGSTWLLPRQRFWHLSSGVLQPDVQLGSAQLSTSHYLRSSRLVFLQWRCSTSCSLCLAAYLLWESFACVKREHGFLQSHWWAE